MSLGTETVAAPDAGGAHQAAVGDGLVGGVVLGGAQQRADVPQTAHRVKPSVQLAVLVVGHAEPDPRAESDDQSNHRERRDDDDDAQREDARQQQNQPLAAEHYDARGAGTYMPVILPDVRRRRVQRPTGNMLALADYPIAGDSRAVSSGDVATQRWAAVTNMARRGA